MSIFTLSSGFSASVVAQTAEQIEDAERRAGADAPLRGEPGAADKGRLDNDDVDAVPAEVARERLEREDGERARDSRDSDRDDPDRAKPTTHLLGMSLVADDNSMGALIEEVDPLGAAWSAGIRPGDVVMKVGGFEAKSFDKLREVIRELVDRQEKGEPLAFTVRRKGEMKDFRVVAQNESADEARRDRRSEAQATDDSNDSRMQGPTDGDQGRATRGAGQPQGGTSATGSAGANPYRGRVDGYDDDDYYFFDDGGFGYGHAGTLTAAQQAQFDRLESIAAERSLSNSQQLEMDRLRAMQNDDFRSLGPLSDAEAKRLQELRQQGGDLTRDEQQMLRQLTGRELQQDGDFGRQLQQLRRAAQEGSLTPEQRQRFERLQAFRGSPASGQPGATGPQNSQGQNPFAVDQRSRFRDLASRRGKLNEQEMAEFARLQSQRGQAMQQEFQRAQQMRSRGQRFTPRQQARFNRLQQAFGGGQGGQRGGAAQGRPTASPRFQGSPAANTGQRPAMPGVTSGADTNAATGSGPGAGTGANSGGGGASGAAGGGGGN